MPFRIFLIFCLLFALTKGQAQLREIKVGDIGVSVPTNLQTRAVEKVEKHKLFKVEKIKIQYLAQPTIRLKNVRYKNVVLEDKKIKVPTSLQVKTYVSMERKQAIAFAFVPQYIKEASGQIKKIESYELDVQQQSAPSRKKTGNRVYAANSVLASGTWHKIAIKKQGLYKIDFNFLRDNLGLNMSSLNPATIRIFGNGGEMLPEDNNIIPHDDLVENHVIVQGGGDGKFDASDFVLFYANGPHTILSDSVNKRFTHRYNNYNNQSYYYINVGTTSGKRVQNQVSLGSANQTVRTGNFFTYYDEDLINVGRVGTTWWSDVYGNLPGKSLSKTVSLSAPNIDNATPVHVRTRAGGVAFAGTSTFRVSVNGQLAHTVPLEKIGYEFFDPYVRIKEGTGTLTTSGNNLSVNTQFTPSNGSAAGYIDFVELNGRMRLDYFSGMKIMDWNSVGNGNIAEFELGGANAQAKVWDVTDPLKPIAMNTTNSGGTLRFRQGASKLHKFVAFHGSSFSEPTYVGKVANQDLHSNAQVDYLIIAYPNFVSQANALAAFHAERRGYKSLVVTPAKIYNEFSSGSQDVSAIRNFIKMFYDKANGAADAPRNVLFFGDGSYDFKNRIPNNTNFVPAYQTQESDDKSTSYCSDDFYGFLDDNEDPNKFGDPIFVNTLDIGVGRIPASTTAEANNAVAKIKNYDSPNSFGPWKNTMVFNADDEDGNAHLDDAEIMSDYVTDNYPQYNNYKIYVDAFQQNSTPAGPRTLEANRTIKEHLFNGTFVVNYNGHGGPLGWCEERILNMEDIRGLENKNKLPIFITATCDFTQFDNPDQKSAGEVLFANPNGGAIALMTTTRLVYQFQNRQMNLNYFNQGFKEMDNGELPTLGDAYRLSKNIRYVSSISEFDAANFRKFALIGDPGLPLAFPKHQVKTDSVRDLNGNAITDTLKALGKYTVSGRVTDKNNNLLTGFNGTVFPTIFDKPKSLTTLANDPGSYQTDFEIQNNVLYKGQATVKNGLFSYTFVVPKDINYSVAKGKISYYANDATSDATGFDRDVFIGGSSSTGISDNKGPDIDPFINDRKFVNGGITQSEGTLLIDLFDENGINYSGNSVGHDITAVLDGDAQKTFVLNNFYESALDDYQKGVVRFPLEGIAEGKHSLRIKAWDVLNNSSEVVLDFIVVSSTEGKLARVYNYPNPFSTSTRFMFEHNMPNQTLQVSLKIFSMTGKVVKRFRETINTPGTRYDGIMWDGNDQYSEKLANGVYLYKLSIKSENGFSDDKIQKLIILR